MFSKKNVVEQILHSKSKQPVLEKATAFAPINIALIKYWGKRDETLNLPLTSSLSIALPKHGTRTTIAEIKNADHDVIFLNGKEIAKTDSFAARLSQVLDVYRPTPQTHYHIDTENNIPTAAGLASSASGFAALILALNALYGWALPESELSILCRLASGSACRSLWNGFVEWQRGERTDGMDSFAKPIPVEWPELHIGICLLSAAQKTVSSKEAMRRTLETVPDYQRDWCDIVAEDLADLKIALATRNFTLLGSTAEKNALAMHAFMLKAKPSVDYCLPETLALREKIWQLRKAGTPVYFTQDAGPNLKVLFWKKDRENILREIPKMVVG